MQTCASLSDLAKTGKQIDKPDTTLKRITLPDPSFEAWLMSLDAGAGQDWHCSDVLSRDELQRADRFHFERDRRRFMVTRSTLRMLLARQLGIAPAAIVFGFEKNGKPRIAKPAVQIHFNVSHSGERALIAISRSFRLGVDIEYLNRDIDCDGLARRYFTHRESATLQHLPAASRKRAFLACWTRKEAVIKATGDGLSLPLDQFEVTVEPDAALRILAATNLRIADWTLYVADVGNDYVATVAAYRGK
jgi:4'-phosphopantetheinyl transferase